MQTSTVFVYIREETLENKIKDSFYLKKHKNLNIENKFNKRYATLLHCWDKLKLNKWRAIPSSYIWTLNIVKMFFLSKLISISSNPINDLVGFIEIWKYKDPSIAKTILKEKSKLQGLYFMISRLSVKLQ